MSDTDYLMNELAVLGQPVLAGKLNPNHSRTVPDRSYHRSARANQGRGSRQTLTYAGSFGVWGYSLIIRSLTENRLASE